MSSCSPWKKGESPAVSGDQMQERARASILNRQRQLIYPAHPSLILLTVPISPLRSSLLSEFLASAVDEQFTFLRGKKRSLAKSDCNSLHKGLTALFGTVLRLCVCPTVLFTVSYTKSVHTKAYYTYMGLRSSRRQAAKDALLCVLFPKHLLKAGSRYFQGGGCAGGKGAEGMPRTKFQQRWGEANVAGQWVLMAGASKA